MFIVAFTFCVYCCLLLILSLVLYVTFYALHFIITIARSLLEMQLCGRHLSASSNAVDRMHALFTLRQTRQKQNNKRKVQKKTNQITTLKTKHFKTDWESVHVQQRELPRKRRRKFYQHLPLLSKCLLGQGITVLNQLAPIRVYVLQIASAARYRGFLHGLSSCVCVMCLFRRMLGTLYF